MKHTHCHCGLKEQLKKFRAGKLGLLGGALILGHLLFHVAECLVLPAIFLAVGSNAEGETHPSSELSILALQETTFGEFLKHLPLEVQEN